MRLIDCEQNTPEWHAARCGRVTASRIADIMRKTKTGVSKMRQTYAGELVAERLSGIQQETFVSKPMQWGKDTEDTAREVYGFLHNVVPARIGFVVHPGFEMAGASPDSLVGDDGQIEIKCPNSSTHIETLEGAEIDPDYMKQMQWGMACTGRAWCDFVSFDPRFPPAMQMAVRRVERDRDLILELETEVAKFLAEVDAMVQRLRARFEIAEAA
jgi:putative phage-type endonuclease